MTNSHVVVSLQTKAGSSSTIGSLNYFWTSSLKPDYVLLLFHHQTTFPTLYQSLCLSDSDLWLSFSQSSQCEQEIPSSAAKKVSPFQQVCK